MEYGGAGAPSPGVRVSSMDGYIPANLITLDRGMIRRFSGLDLQHDYFRQDLIEEQGLGGSPLRTNLPEGFYTFRVQALEAGTGREVSNIGETYFSITTPFAANHQHSFQRGRTDDGRRSGDRAAKGKYPVDAAPLPDAWQYHDVRSESLQSAGRIPGRRTGANRSQPKHWMPV
ncbi:hypothetical protein [Dyadobacter diqingensis]|uniref:hypothetical protein n=1 Tax=Dyadobacter diqingensis TaxID=2938121 RepID=UPI0020C1A623|nr:hypothetical protein [Dyadobacter diqingensis]